MNSSIFLALCSAHGLPEPEPEVRFAPPRKWRADWLWGPPHKLILEVQGGLFVRGRHTQGAALLKEYEKLNAAACLGYRVLFCVPKDVETGAVFETLRRAMAGE